MYTNVQLSISGALDFLPYLSFFTVIIYLLTTKLLPAEKLSSAPGYKKLKIKEEYHSRILALIMHSIATFYYFSYYHKYVLLYFFGEQDDGFDKLLKAWESQPNKDYADTSRHPENLRLLKFILAYLLVDAYWMYHYKYIDKAMIFHHCIGIVGTLFGEPLPNCCACSMLEMSNFFTQIRWYSKFHGFFGNFGNFIVDSIFLAAFIFFRVVISVPFAKFCTFDTSNSWTSTKIISVSAMFMNFGFATGVFMVWVKSLKRLKTANDRKNY